MNMLISSVAKIIAWGQNEIRNVWCLRAEKTILRNLPLPHAKFEHFVSKWYAMSLTWWNISDSFFAIFYVKFNFRTLKPNTFDALIRNSLIWKQFCDKINCLLIDNCFCTLHIPFMQLIVLKLTCWP